MRKRIVLFFTIVSMVFGMALVTVLLVRWPRETDQVALAPAAITRLTSDPATDLRPVWSPDGRWIAFESNREGSTFHIYVMRPDGSGLRALTGGDSDDRRPVWSRDGRAILFDSFDGTRQEIWSVELASGDRKQLTHSGGLASFASPSPDGKRIAFYLYVDGTLDLWTARAEGSDARPLTRALASADKDQCSFACHEAAWSPDGQRVAYTGGDGKSIWTVDADGANAQSIVEDGETNHFPWFLPDGRLAFITEYVPPDYGGAWTNAWAYDLRTGQRTLLQEFMSMQGPMDWSPDRTLILFHSPRAGNFDTFLINLNAPGGLAALRGTPVPEEQEQDR